MTTEPEQPASDAPADGAPPAAGESPPTPPRKRLMRSRDDEMIAGVAGGIAEYFDVDPVLIRVGLVVMAFLTSGAAIAAYIVAWIVMPEAGTGTSIAQAGGTTTPRQPRKSNGAAAGIVWGVILIAVGAFVLLQRLDIDLPPWQALLSGVLILLGLLILLEARKGLNGGLVALAIGVSVVLGATSAVDVEVGSGFGDRRVNVTRADDLDDSYGHAFGSMTVDLTDLEVPAGTTDVSVSVAFGDATLRLPPGVPYRLSASSVFGSVDAPTFDADGVAVDRSYRTEDYDNATNRLDIDVSVLFGSARVR
ncbi:MAG: hypothetical protein AMXMBFR23_22090 [Chloroflexota bacterium]